MHLFLTGMAFYFSYSNEIKENIGRVIRSYLDCLHFESAEIVLQNQAGMLQDLDASLRHDAKELREIHRHYRDHLAKGCVYIAQYKNRKSSFFIRDVLGETNYDSDNTMNLH